MGAVSLAISVLAMATLAASSSHAVTTHEAEFVCPIDGAAFRSLVFTTFYIGDRRLDSRPVYGGSLQFLPKPECPGNGFIIYKAKFDDDEIRKAKKFIETIEFTAMRRDHASSATRPYSSTPFIPPPSANQVKGYLLPHFYSGATGLSGRLSEGVLLRRLQAGGPINSGAISTFMRRTVTSENRVTRLPDGMPLREAALLGCAIPTGPGIVFNSLKVKPGDSLVIFDAGGVGLSALIAATSAGANPLIVVDIVAEKLAKARSLGATHAIDGRTTDAILAVRDLTGGCGADYAIEASGHPAAMKAAFEAVRAGGGSCVIAGNAAHGKTISLNPFSLISGKRIDGSWGGESRPDEDIPRYAALFGAGRFPLSELITAEYALADINQAIDDLEGGRVARALVAL